MRLYDTASGQVQELLPRRAGEIAMYVCGPTVYGEPHIGHGRFSLVYDVLRRYLLSRGNDVRYVSNITDIDDKVIARSNEEHRSWSEVAAECEQQWWEAMDALGVLRPTVAPRATEYVQEMVELIAQLLERGAAYETSDGIYLDVTAVPDYGLLAHRHLEDLLESSSARIEVRDEKRSPADFALWKKAKPGEPTWAAPFGDGRPGWHTECVAMSLGLLGDDFDLHGGGLDLVFPHHENERAQVVALGRMFARHWLHSGLVEIGGEKMSKSLGNVTTLREMLEDHDGRSYRLLVLRSHYRSAIEVSSDTLVDAENALARVDACARRFVELPAEQSEESAALATAFHRFMEEDLDTPRAVAQLFEAIRRAHSLADEGAIELGAALGQRVLELFGSLGLDAVSGSEHLDDAAQLLASERDVARAARDFDRVDHLRGQLEALGWVVEDGPSGTRIRR